MAENSKIEWTNHTFNPWWGCTKVSPACEHCYAEAWAKRVGQPVWGPKSGRRVFADPHWREPVKWNREAAAVGVRARVFCASMADVFEDRSELSSERKRLWKLIEETPALDWLLLTKRPENVGSMVPWGAQWPRNVWLGTTVENQKYAEIRIPKLLAQPSLVHFVSCEPLLGSLDLARWLKPRRTKAGASRSIDWVIAGGESGGNARPMTADWARSLRDQCTDAAVAFHFKQWGVWAPLKTSRAKRDDGLVRLGKTKAGRLLDGRTWDGLPSVAGTVSISRGPRRVG